RSFSGYSYKIKASSCAAGDGVRAAHAGPPTVASRVRSVQTHEFCSKALSLTNFATSRSRSWRADQRAATYLRCSASTCGASASASPLLSITSSAAASRASRLACAARIDSTRSALRPLRRCTRSICTHRAVDHQHAVEAARAPARLDEQRHDVEHVWTGRGENAALRFVADHRVQ